MKSEQQNDTKNETKEFIKWTVLKVAFVLVIILMFYFYISSTHYT